MSVESTIYGIIGMAKSLASSTANDASSMAVDAAAVLTGYTPRYPTEFPTAPSESGVSVPGGSALDTTKKLPEFPTIRQPKTIPAPSLGGLDSLDEEFTATAPQLSLPDFRYRTPSALPEFTDTAPAIDTKVTLPAAPDTTWPTRPTLGKVNTAIEIDPVAVPAMPIHRPRYTPATLDPWRTAFEDGQSLVPSLDAYGTSLLNRLCPGYNAMYAGLRERVEGILSGRTTALGARFDDALFQQARRRTEMARSAAISQLDAAAESSGWDMPGRVRHAGQIRLSADIANTLSVAALEAYTKRSEREVQHLQFTMDIAARLHGMALDLFKNAVGLQMEGFKAALMFADAASNYAIKVYELRQRDFEIESKLMALEIEIFEALLKAELAKLEVGRARIENEKLKSDLNQQLIQQYTAELQAIETKARVYATQIGAIKEEMDLRRVPLELYMERIKAHGLLVDAKKAEYAALEAEIAGDKARVDGQMARLQVYKTEADVFKTTVDAKAAKISAQAKRNDQLLEVYKTQVATELSLVQTDEAIARHALDAFEATAKIYLAELQAQLENARFRFDKGLENAKLKLEEVRFEYDAEFKAIELEMTRIKAIGELNMNGAQVHGQLASSALSSLNSVVSAAVSSEV